MSTTTTRTDAEDTSPLPSTPILTEEETSRQIRADADKYNPRIRQLELENIKLLEENHQLRTEFSSGICSAHQLPDPLHCPTCRGKLDTRSIRLIFQQEYNMLLEAARAAKVLLDNCSESEQNSTSSYVYTDDAGLLHEALKSLEESGVKI